MRPRPSSFGPFGYFTTELASRIVLSSPGCPHYCCIDTESNRGDGFNVSHKSLRVSSQCPQDPFRSASQTMCISMAQKCVWDPNPTGTLDDSPRALGDCRGPSKKSPSALLCRRANTYIWCRGWTTAMGPSEWIRLKEILLACV